MPPAKRWLALSVGIQPDHQGGDNDALKKTQAELDKLKQQLKSAEADRDAMKEQSENLQKEYNRLADEHNSASKGDKKSD